MVRRRSAGAAGRGIPWARPWAGWSPSSSRIAIVGEGLARLSALLESLLGDLFANRTSVELMRHAATLDLEQFENPDIYDKLERARRQTVDRIGLFTLLLATVQDLITLVTLARGARAYVPWLLLLLAVAVLPSFLGRDATTPRWATRCCTPGPPSGACSTTSATSAPVTSRPRR